VVSRNMFGGQSFILTHCACAEFYEVLGGLSLSCIQAVTYTVSQLCDACAADAAVSWRTMLLPDRKATEMG